MFMKIIRFDEPLIGVPLIENGYRIALDNKHDMIPPYQEILSFLGKSFGLGLRENTDLTALTQSLVVNWHKGPGWSLVDRMDGKRHKLVIVVDTSSRLKLLCDTFDWKILEIDEDQTVEGRIKLFIKPLVFSKITKRRVAYIRQKIAELVRLRWYQIWFNARDSTIEFKRKNKNYKIQVGNIR